MLVAANGAPAVTGDFSEIVSAGRIVTSIDRIHRCAQAWDQFARIALNHAFADVLCAGGRPIQVMLSFEFGIDISPAERIACSSAFNHELNARGIPLGKCHSGHGAGVTAVTIATLASAPMNTPRVLRQGRIFLSRPIGAAKLLYLSELGDDVAGDNAVTMLEAGPDPSFLNSGWSVVSDVSGHGLLGAAIQIGALHKLRIDLELSATHAISPEVLAVPAECLQNPFSSYGIPADNIDERAVTLATLRETAGPFLGFVEDGDELDQRMSGLFVGRYREEGEGIGISWLE